MTKIFKNNNEIFYFTQNAPVQESGHYSVILSPEFYWIKKVQLPVKKISAAKKLAQSVFEGSLPEGDFAYEVSKEDDAFIIIAYDKEKVSLELADKFTKEAKVQAVYFAQNEFNDLKECCGVDETSSLVNINGLILQVPRVCTESKEEISALLKGKKLSKHKITLGALESSVISTKEFSMLAAGVAILLSSFVLDWVNYKSAAAKLEEKRSEIIKKNHLPQTSIQLNSIKKSLTKTFKTQKKIRDAVYGFNAISLKEGEYIDRINAGSKETVVVIKVDSSAREEELKTQISKSLKVKSSAFKDNLLTIRVAS